MRLLWCRLPNPLKDNQIVVKGVHGKGWTRGLKLAGSHLGTAVRDNPSAADYVPPRYSSCLLEEAITACKEVVEPWLVESINYIALKPTKRKNMFRSGAPERWRPPEPLIAKEPAGSEWLG